MRPDTPIKNIMTTKVISVTTTDTLGKVRTIFDENAFHHIPVLTPEGLLAGIISKEDWLTKLMNISTQTTGKVWTNFQYQSVLARDIMTPNPITLDPDDHIGLAADLFLSNKFHAVPIVEAGEFQGLLTSHDLLQYAFDDVLEKKLR